MIPLVCCSLFWLMLRALSYNHLSHHRVTALKDSQRTVLAPIKSWALSSILPFKMQMNTNTLTVTFAWKYAWFYDFSEQHKPVQPLISSQQPLVAWLTLHIKPLSSSVSAEYESRFSLPTLPSLPSLPQQISRERPRGHATEGKMRTQGNLWQQIWRLLQRSVSWQSKQTG